nr:AMP-binding protein [Nocardia coubleae]
MNATLSLASILAEPARRRPEHLALIEGEHRITFADLWRQARAQAAALIARGVKPGDRVALLCPNTADSRVPTSPCWPRVRRWCRCICCSPRRRWNTSCATAAPAC